VANSKDARVFDPRNTKAGTYQSASQQKPVREAARCHPPKKSVRSIIQPNITDRRILVVRFFHEPMLRHHRKIA
jgi:hypothetical protein